MLQIRPPSPHRVDLLACVRGLFMGLVVTAFPGKTWAQQDVGGLNAELTSQVQMIAQAGARAGMPAHARVEVQVGRLDPRLRLAPCLQVQPYLPPGLQMWGRTRIGIRCLDGAVRWNVSLPVTVKVYARALVAADVLPAGAVLSQALLSSAEIDIAAEAGSVFSDANSLVGRTLNRPLAAGEAVRSSSLKVRQWFAAGDTVMVRAVGSGYTVAREGQALTAGLEGQSVKVRFENGRIVSGRVVGERNVEMLL
jgi:flagella basal body P-ring formation protein FlgA